MTVAPLFNTHLSICKFMANFYEESVSAVKTHACLFSRLAQKQEQQSRMEERSLGKEESREHWGEAGCAPRALLALNFRRSAPDFPNSHIKRAKQIV